jgi:hypothetical protein
MPIASLQTSSSNDFQLAHRFSWWDAEAGCSLVMSQPGVDPELWEDYLAGAEKSYRRHGVAAALEMDSFRDGHDTALFWTALDPNGKVIGGLRAKGPLTCADDSHAVLEWEGQPGEAAVRKMIDDRVPFGVLEMKSAFTTDDPGRSKYVTQVLARTAFHAMAAMDLQFCMATSAGHVLDKWRTSGGVVAAIPATPYPTPQYRTKMMWWDRRNFIQHAEPEQVSKIFNDLMAMESALPVSDATGRRGAAL